MYNTSFIKKILLVATVVFLYSCDKDFNAIGDDLVGDNHFDFETYTSNVVAYNQKVTPIQSNNLTINKLGIYNDPAFGETAAHFNTQLSLAAYSPEIGEGVVVDSVIMTVPYFSHIKTVKPDGTSEYELDSIYGPNNGKIKLSVYESGYYMRNLNPVGGFQTTQLYYTDQNADFDGLKVAYNGKPLNDSSDKNQNEEFYFSTEQIPQKSTDATGKVTVTKLAPQMYLKLNTDFFKEKILDASKASYLTSADVFLNYFRGLYFKVEKSGSNPGTMGLLNFKDSNSKITIYYRAKTAITTDEDSVLENKSIVINMTGNTVNLLEQTNTNAAYSSAITNANTTLGDKSLYLKGGEGSMAVIELFGKTDVIGYDKNGNLVQGPNGVPDELDNLRYPADGKKLLINEANLIFHIDSDAMKNSDEPNRIYLYDLNNNRPIMDYYTDGSSGPIANPKLSKIVFGGIIDKTGSTDSRGVTYKVRITNQIRSLIKNVDSTNVKLGVVVSEDINVIASNKLKTPGTIISQAARASVMSPLGTILFGGTSDVPDDKKLKLQIYYTKPN